MDIWQTEKLALFIAFVIPGFISIKVYELLYPGVPRDSSKQLVDAVAYSCINYALLFVPIYAIETNRVSQSSPILYSVFYGFVLLVAPVIWVWLWRIIRNTKLIQKAAPHPTAKPWDYVFSKGEPYWIKITLKDATKIAGKFGSNSFASSGSAAEQIYLEETWLLNEKGGLDRPKNQTAGVIVTSSEIAYVELMKWRK